MLSKRVHNSEMRSQDVTPELWNPGEYNCQWNPLAVEYYDHIVKQCQDKGIQVVALCFPSVTNADRDSARWESLKAYLDSRGVACLNYASFEQYQALGMDLERDCFDNSHLNVIGADRFTKAVARDLTKLCGLPDRRQDAAVSPQWDALINDYQTYYQGEK